MTRQERADTAANLKATGACNCCQAVTQVLADTVDLDAETLKKLSSGFMIFIKNHYRHSTLCRFYCSTKSGRTCTYYY